MRVMVIVKASRASEAGEMPREKLLTEMGNYNEELVKAGIMQAGEGLHPSSKGARVKFSGRERTVIDGPFAETKELIAGFWIWKVKSMAEAIDWLKRCPNPHDDECEVEIRPIFSADDFGAEFTPELREQEASIRAQTLGLGAIRYEQLDALSLVGLNGSYVPKTCDQIPDQWRRFAPHLGKVPGRVGKLSYGVVWNSKGQCEFDYLTAVEANPSASLPAEFTRLKLAARRYAVFTHAGDVSTIPSALETLWMKWAPESGLAIAQTPFFERYTEEHNPQTGRGGIEFWIPLES